MNDLRFAFRQLLGNPGFTTVAVLTLALGIGANTVIFDLVNAVLLRPMAVEKPEEIVWIEARRGPLEPPESSSYLDYLDFRDGSRDVLTGAAAVSSIPSAIYLGGADARTKRVWSSVVSGNYFSVLGVRTKFGRLFLPEDDEAGAAPAVVLSEHAWRQLFGGDVSVLGKAIRINELSCTIIGIVPDKAAVVQRALQVDVFLPVAAFAQLKGSKPSLESRGYRPFDVIGRLRPDVSVGQAIARFDVLAAQLQHEYPREWTTEREGHVVARRLRLVPEAQSRIPPLFGSAGILSYLAVLAAIVAIVPLIACANLANLLLARATSRRKEFAVRLALGAPRGRLIRQLVTESLLIALLGGAVGLLLAIWATHVLVAWNPVNRFSPMMPPIDLELAIDIRVLIFAFVLSGVTALLFGLAPAWQAVRTDLASSLTERGTTDLKAHRPFALRNVLIVAQVAMSLILVTGAGLLFRGVLRTGSLDLGFDRSNLALLTIAMDQRDKPPQETQVLLQELLHRVQSLPGVQAAEVAFWVPLGLGQMNLDTALDGYVMSPNEHVAPEINLVGPHFFDTLRVPVLRGRSFSTNDAGTAEVVINEAMAKRYWPGQDPIGRRLQNLFGSFQIVGVTKTMKYAGFMEGPTPMYFLPVAAWFKKTTPPTLTFLVRTTTPPNRMLETLRRELQLFTPDLPVLDAKTMDEHLALRAFPTRLAAVVAGVFGTLALLLAAIGLYGVTAYFVSQRTRELGIRVALGAQRIDILRLVICHGLTLVGIGAAIGLAGASTFSRLVESLLYGLSPTDAATFVGVTLVLAGVSFLACYLPARRATKIDPMEALRHE